MTFPEKLVRAVVLVGMLIYGGSARLGVDIEPIFVESFVYFNAVLLLILCVVLEGEALVKRRDCYFAKVNRFARVTHFAGWAAAIVAAYGITALLVLIYADVFVLEKESVDLFGLYTLYPSTFKKFDQLSHIACWVRYRQRAGVPGLGYGFGGLLRSRPNEMLAKAILLVGVPLGAGGYALGYTG